MTKEILYLMSMSCVLPVAAGFYRFGKIDKKFRPFIYMKLLDMLIETFLYLHVSVPVIGKYPYAVLNLYMIINFCFFLVLVVSNNYLNKKTLPVLLALALITALFNFFYNDSKLDKTFFYLLCFVSAVMLVVSIDILSRQVMEIREKLTHNFWFWFSSFSILYNALNLLIFGLYFFTMFDTPNGKAIAYIQHFANVVCNVFFAIAVSSIPAKRELFYPHTDEAQSKLI